MTGVIMLAAVFAGVVVGVFGCLLYVAWKLRDTL